MSVFLEQTLRLFRGRGDVYAQAFPREGRANKVNYALVREPLLPSVLQQHLDGERLIGQYQLLPDSTVWWFAVDFDEGEQVLQDAVAQLEAFEEAGLHCYLETSRSGTGYHVWGFLDEPVPASVVRRALLPALVRADSFDRLYPVQTEVSEGKPYGNLIALPFFGMGASKDWASPLGGGVPAGAGVFLNPSTLEPVGCAEFVEVVLRNKAAVLHALAEAAPAVTSRASTGPAPVAYGEVQPKGRPEQPVAGVFKMISDYGCQFMAHCFKERRTLSEPMWYAALQQLTCFKHGREAAHMISRDYPTYSPQETDAKFTQALRHPPVGCAYIHEHFPQLACKDCSMKAPYHMADVPIRDLVKETTEPLKRSDYRQATARMHRRLRGEELTGVTWGVANLDQYTRLRPSELTVVGAPPSIGKTAMLVDAAVSLAMRGTPAFVFSAETGQAGIEDRLLARVSGVDSRAIRGERTQKLTEAEIRQVEEAADTLRSLPLYVQYTAANPDLILQLIEDTVLRDRLSAGNPYVTFFDYLQFTSLNGLETGLKEYERLSMASQEFKYLAKILRQPVVLLSQLVRSAEGEEEPALNWFKGTGRIEADMDVGLIMTGERTPGQVAKRKLWVVKQREGEAGVSNEVLLYQTVSRFGNEPMFAARQPKTTDLFAGERDLYAD